MGYAVVPTIIAATPDELDALVRKLWFSPTLHLDVMDSQFVANSSLNFNFNIDSTHTYEAHLMVADPEAFVRRYGENECITTIIFHYEALRDDRGLMGELIESIRAKGKCAGIAINPDTDIREVRPIITEHNPELVLVMTVQPGQYGAPFVSESPARIRELARIYKGVIAVDGSQNPQTIPLCKDAGATHFAVGSYISQNKGKEPISALEELQRLVGNEPNR